MLSDQCVTVLTLVLWKFHGEDMDNPSVGAQSRKMLSLTLEPPKPDMRNLILCFTSLCLQDNKMSLRTSNVALDRVHDKDGHFDLATLKVKLRMSSEAEIFYFTGSQTWMVESEWNLEAAIFQLYRSMNTTVNSWGIMFFTGTEAVVKCVPVECRVVTDSSPQCTEIDLGGFETSDLARAKPASGVEAEKKRVCGAAEKKRIDDAVEKKMADDAAEKQMNDEKQMQKDREAESALIDDGVLKAQYKRYRQNQERGYLRAFSSEDAAYRAVAEDFKNYMVEEFTSNPPDQDHDVLGYLNRMKSPQIMAIWKRADMETVNHFNLDDILVLDREFSPPTTPIPSPQAKKRARDTDQTGTESTSKKVRGRTEAAADDNDEEQRNQNIISRYNRVTSAETEMMKQKLWEVQIENQNLMAEQFSFREQIASHTADIEVQVTKIMASLSATLKRFKNQANAQERELELNKRIIELGDELETIKSALVVERNGVEQQIAQRTALLSTTLEQSEVEAMAQGREQFACIHALRSELATVKHDLEAERADVEAQVAERTASLSGSSATLEDQADEQNRSARISELSEPAIVKTKLDRAARAEATRRGPTTHTRRPQWQ